MREEEREATTPKGLWLLTVAGPLILAAEFQTNFVLVRQACSTQRSIWLYAVLVVATLLTVATAMAAVSILRRAGSEWPNESADLANRVRFLAVLGILSSAMSFLVILAQAIATVIFDPCQL